MKSQKHNQGELEEVSVNIEKKIAQKIKKMATNKGTDVSEVVVIALKRFIASHAELEGKSPKF